jgi:hypothetical protein
MTTAFAATEVVFVCVAVAKAGFAHDLVQTELGEVEPVAPPE